MVNPGVDGYTKTLNQGLVPKSFCSREGFPQSFCSREGFSKSFCSRESFVVRKYSETRKMTTPYKKTISGEVTFSWSGESNRPSSLPSITPLQQTL